MFRFVGNVEATLLAHSFRVFLIGAAALVMIRIPAWVLDRPLRSRTGGGYASDAQLAAIGCGAMAASLAVRLWWPVAFAQGLVVVVAVAAVVGVVLHRAAHPPVVIAMGAMFQAVFAGAAYLVAWPFLSWVVGAWVAYSWVTSPSTPSKSERENWLDEYRSLEQQLVERESASQHWQEEEAKRQAGNAQPVFGEWLF